MITVACAGCYRVREGGPAITWKRMAGRWWCPTCIPYSPRREERSDNK